MIERLIWPPLAVIYCIVVFPILIVICLVNLVMNKFEEWRER